MSWTNQNSSSSAGGGGVIKFSQGALLTPSAGVITPTDSFHHVAAGAITSIATTNFDTSVGNLLILQADGTVTFTASSSLKVKTLGLFTDETMVLVLDGTNWVEAAHATSNQGIGIASNAFIPLSISSNTGAQVDLYTANNVANFIQIEKQAGNVAVVGQESSIAATTVSGSLADSMLVGTISGEALHLVTSDIVRVTVSSGGNVSVVPLAVTAGTMTVTNSAHVRSSLHRFDWTNAMVVALGASLTGDIAVCTLPAKTRVKNVYVVIKTADTSANALTVAVGRTGAAYIDYIVASDAKAAANTVYGDAVGERGANLTGYDLPSYTSTTVVNAHFIKTTSNLSTVLTSTGTVFIETELLP